MLADGPLAICHTCKRPLREGEARYRTPTGETHVRCHEGPRVLVVEDDSVLRDLIIGVVQRVGYVADAAANGREAIQQIPRHHYDVILCDLRMPGMDGQEFYREVQRSYPNLTTRIVFMTAHADLEEFAPFVREVRAPVLKKPFYIHEFRAALSRMVGPRDPRR